MSPPLSKLAVWGVRNKCLCCSRNKCPCQNSTGENVTDDALLYRYSTRYEDSFVIIDGEDSESEFLSAAKFPPSAPSTVSILENISNTESSGADDIIEAEPGDIFMKQLVIIKKKDGGDYIFEEGQIDTGNDAKHMLVGKRLVKELGLKRDMEPVLGQAELQGINGPILRPTRFVRLTFKMPRLGLDWVKVKAYVVEGNVGFNLGNRAVLKFGLLGRLLEQIQDNQEWVHLDRRGPSPASASTVNVLMDVRSKGKVKEDARKHQERRPLAADIATFREGWQRGYRSSSEDGQSTYEPSVESYDDLTTTASTFIDMASSSRAPTWSSSATSVSMESSKQEQKR